jgi:hypothetical protein
MASRGRSRLRTQTCHLINENSRLKLDWSLQRTLAKINYRIHTDAIKDTLLPPTLTKAQASLVYANEADLLNVALFGQTAKQWRDAHPDAEGNIRDSFLQTLHAMKTNTICPVGPIRAQTSGLAAA